MYVWDVYQPSNYRKWNIIDLWDYLYDFYADNAQEDPATYGAVYDGPVPADFPNDPDKQAEVTAWRASRATQVDGTWFWKFSNNKIVSKFYDLTFMWRSDITNWKSQENEYPNRKYAKQYIHAQRNYYIISAEAWRVILRERYSDFKFMTSFSYDYKTGKRNYYDTIAEAAELLRRTFSTFEHDKIDALTKLMYALRKDYDPVENYDKHSDIETHKYGSESTRFTPQGSETDTLAKAGKETTKFEKGSEQRDHSKTTYDDSTALLTDRDELKGTNGVAYTDSNELSFSNNRADTNTHEFSNDRKDDTWTQYGKTPSGSTDDRYDKTTEHTHGNIGVTTSQQMIQSQFPIEYYDEIEHYTASEFVHKYLVLA